MNPKMPWWAKDWLSDNEVRGMTLAQRGAYVDAISFCWLHGSIPANANAIARMLGVNAGSFSRHIWPVLASHFYEVSPGRLTNKRVEKERQKLAEEKERERRRWRRRKGSTPGGAPPVHRVHSTPDSATTPDGFHHPSRVRGPSIGPSHSLDATPAAAALRAHPSGAPAAGAEGTGENPRTPQGPPPEIQEKLEAASKRVQAASFVRRVLNGNGSMPEVSA